MSQKEQPKKVKFLTKKRQEPDKNEEKQKENIFLMPEPLKVQNNKITTYIYNASEEQMKTAIENWDGNDITTLPFVSKENSVGHKIEKAVRPLLQEWIQLKKQQNSIEGKPTLLAKKSDSYQELNKQLLNIQTKITEKRSYYINKQGQRTKQAGQISKDINSQLIQPVFDKFGGKARSIKCLKRCMYDNNNQSRWNYYTKKNKQFINVYSAPEIVKNIMTKNKLNNFKQLTNYLSQQQNISYTPSQIKDIMNYVRTRAVQSIQAFSNNYKSVEHICGQYQHQIKQIFDNNKQHTFTIVGKENSYTFKQMIGVLIEVQNKMNDFKNNVQQALNNNQVVVNNVLDVQQTNQVNNQDIQHQNVDTQPNQNNNNINEQPNNNQIEQQDPTQKQNIDYMNPFFASMNPFFADMDPFFDDDLDNNINNAFHSDFAIFDENVIQDNQGQQFYNNNTINLNNDTQINNTNTMYPFITQGNNI